MHGDTYELWPRQSAAEGNLTNLQLPINLDTSPSGIGGGTSYGPRPLYPHMHLLPTYETLVVATKCAPLTSVLCFGGRPLSGTFMYLATTEIGGAKMRFLQQ